MAGVVLKNIYKKYPGNEKFSVTDFNLDIEDKEFIVFVGPSGCGKSTTLRMIAGLEDITSGELWIDGNLVNDKVPKDRDIAMVFQNYALYPHMSVFDNMAFGLKLRKVDKETIKQKVNEAARILGISEYLQRKPKALSGGQRQRVALGRAIVRSPKVFLLDEPLSNLDAKLRAQMRTEITKLHNRLATTFIYVTHDQVEAMTMGTRIVVMKDGFMQQVDTPQNLYDYPSNLFVAGFLGTPQMNFFDSVLVSRGNDVVVKFINTGNEIVLPKEKIEQIIDIKPYLNTGKPVIFGVRPEDVHDEPEFVKNHPNSRIKCKVDLLEKLGAETLLYCSLNFNEKDSDNAGMDDLSAIKSLDEASTTMVAKIDSRSTTERNQVIDVALDTKHIHLFDKETDATLLKHLGVKKGDVKPVQPAPAPAPAPVKPVQPAPAPAPAPVKPAQPAPAPAKPAQKPVPPKKVEPIKPKVQQDPEQKKAPTAKKPATAPTKKPAGK